MILKTRILVLLLPTLHFHLLVEVLLTLGQWRCGDGCNVLARDRSVPLEGHFSSFNKKLFTQGAARIAEGAKNTFPVHVAGNLKTRDIEECWSEVNIEDGLASLGVGRNARARHHEGNVGVELVRERFPLHQPELSEVVAVVGGVEDVGVVQLTRGGQQLHDPLDTIVHRLESLQPLCHQCVSEPSKPYRFIKYKKIYITHLARGSPNANKIVHSVSLHI